MKQLSPLETGRHVIAEEAEALRQVAAGLGEPFAAVVETLRRDGTQVIVSGLGKSGNIAAKIAASLTSTGTPAVCMHPVEALHGDLGIVTQRHALIALSRSGNTDEITRFVLNFRRLGGPVIGITQGRESKLAEVCDHLLLLPDLPEAGPLGLAPTTSTLMMLAMGDALAMALLQARGFGAENFASYHPDGSLGRRLLLRARDLMHAGAELPLVVANRPLHDLLVEMTRKHLGLALIVEESGGLIGTFTDGDLRRLLERAPEPLRLDAGAAYRQSRRAPDDPPVKSSVVTPDNLAVDCLRLMRDSRITSLVVVDEAEKPVGILRLIDLIDAGLG